MIKLSFECKHSLGETHIFAEKWLSNYCQTFIPYFHLLRVSFFFLPTLTYNIQKSWTIQLSSLSMKVKK